jgi:hypothetical protein
MWKKKFERPNFQFLVLGSKTWKIHSRNFRKQKTSHVLFLSKTHMYLLSQILSSKTWALPGSIDSTYVQLEKKGGGGGGESLF